MNFTIAKMKIILGFNFVCVDVKHNHIMFVPMGVKQTDDFLIHFYPSFWHEVFSDLLYLASGRYKNH